MHSIRFATFHARVFARSLRAILSIAVQCGGAKNAEAGPGESGWTVEISGFGLTVVSLPLIA